MIRTYAGVCRGIALLALLAYALPVYAEDKAPEGKTDPAPPRAAEPPAPLAPPDPAPVVKPALAPAIPVARAQAAATPSQLERVQKLIKDLDSNQFDVREEASAALAEFGELAADSLSALLERKPNAEVRRRTRELLDKIHLARISRNPTKIEDLLEQVRLANRKQLDGKEIEARLTRMLEVLTLATGKRDLGLPVRFSSVRAQGADTMSRGLLLVGANLKPSFAQHSIILADTVAEVSHAQDCIIIARVAVQVSHAQNCILIAGESLTCSHAEKCVALCGNKLQFGYLRNSIGGSGGDFSVSMCQNTSVVNTKVEAARMRENSKSMQTSGLVLPVKPLPNPLAEKLTITFCNASSDGFLLFKLTRGGGEYVARLNQDIRTPEGNEIPELKGWKLVHTGQIAVFSNGDQQVCMATGRR